MNAFEKFYRGRRVLVTGDTGLKGAWLCRWLSLLGAEVHGVGLESETVPALSDVLLPGPNLLHTTLDIRDADFVRATLHEVKPSVVFHLAASSSVERSRLDPIETLAVDVMGTAHILDALRTAGYDAGAPCVVVLARSDRCYEIQGCDHVYVEDDPVSGLDIDGTCKGCAELVAAAW